MVDEVVALRVVPLAGESCLSQGHPHHWLNFACRLLRILHLDYSDSGTCCLLLS